MRKLSILFTFLLILLILTLLLLLVVNRMQMEKTYSNIEPRSLTFERFEPSQDKPIIRNTHSDRFDDKFFDYLLEIEETRMNSFHR